MLAAASVSGSNVTLPLALLLGGALWLLMKAESRMPKLPLIIAVLFGASASATILTILNGLLHAFNKG